MYITLSKIVNSFFIVLELSFERFILWFELFLIKTWYSELFLLFYSIFLFQVFIIKKSVFKNPKIHIYIHVIDKLCRISHLLEKDLKSLKGLGGIENGKNMNNLKETVIWAALRDMKWCGIFWGSKIGDEKKIFFKFFSAHF